MAGLSRVRIPLSPPYSPTDPPQTLENTVIATVHAGSGAFRVLPLATDFVDLVCPCRSIFMTIGTQHDKASGQVQRCLFTPCDAC